MKAQIKRPSHLPGRLSPSRSACAGCGFLLTVILAAQPMTSFAFERIPDATGFSGFVNLGVGYLDSKSNTVAGNKVADVGKKTIGSLFGTPKSESDTIPLINAELAYTFAPSRTQIVFGNRLEDFVRFDTTSQLGARKELSDESIIGASVVFNGIKTEVWSDPYVTGQPRKTTDRESSGVRLEYSYILGSNFRAELTWRDIDIDKELSGATQLGLTPAQARLLDRNGESISLELGYRHSWADDKQQLIPAIRYTDFDLDGNAMANDSYLFQLTHLYIGDRWNIATNLAYTNQDYDAVNPIYGRERDDDVFGGSVQVFYKRAFDVDNLAVVGTLAYFDSDSNIDFYDTRVRITGLSALYRF